MKKKNPVHPKLYVDIVENNQTYTFLYMSNVFNDINERIVQKEIKESIPGNKKDFLFNENKKQFEVLKKYLKIQKKVLEKRKKAGNYDACKVIETSINTIADFKMEFNVWFSQNK